MVKLFAFLKRKPGLTHEEFCRDWERFALRVLDVPELAATVRRHVQNRALPGAKVPELTLSDFDGAGEFWFDSLDDLESALRAPGYRALIDSGLGSFVDPASVILLAAQESVQFDRGFGKVKFIGLSRRAASFETREDWIGYWIDVHGPLAHGIPEFTRYYGRYVHNYVLPSGIGPGGPAPEFDGIVEEWLESVDAFAQCLAEPKYLEIVRPDETTFVDFARSHMLVTEEHVVYEAESWPS
jgi:hypothetical protein